MLFEGYAANGAANTITHNPTMRRYGFGEQTGTTEAGNLAQYENGVIEFSEKAAKWATQQYPKESPAGAVALALAEVGGVDLSDYADAPDVDVDDDALRDAVSDVNGVGDETADEIINAVRETLTDGADA